MCRRSSGAPGLVGGEGEGHDRVRYVDKAAEEEGERISESFCRLDVSKNLFWCELSGLLVNIRHVGGKCLGSVRKRRAVLGEVVKGGKLRDWWLLVQIRSSQFEHPFIYMVGHKLECTEFLSPSGELSLYLDVLKCGQSELEANRAFGSQISFCMEVWNRIAYCTMQGSRFGSQRPRRCRTLLVKKFNTRKMKSPPF